jgi:ribosomal protein S12 methylthiotransferase
MPTQAPEIDGVTLINDFEGGEPRPGQMRRLRITEAHDYDLVGTLLAGAETAGATTPSLVQIAV